MRSSLHIPRLRTKALAPALCALLWASGVHSQPVGKLAEPLTNPAGWITAWDYPEAALAAHHEGTITYKLSVGSSGRVMKCTIQGGSGFADLDQATCKILTERARFTPGARRSSTYISQHSWTIPLGLVAENVPQVMARLQVKMRAPAPRTNPNGWVLTADLPPKAGPADPVGIGYRLEVTPQGKVANCTADSSGAGGAELASTTCALLRQRATFWPALDHYGEPIIGVYQGRAFYTPPGPGPRPLGPPDLIFAEETMPEGWGSPIILNAEMLVEADGTPKDCFFRSIASAVPDGTGRRTMTLIPLGESGCQRALGLWMAKPARDGNGKPVPSMQTVTFRFYRRAG